VSLKVFLLCVLAFLTLLYAVETECYAKSSTILGSKYAIDGFPNDWEKQTDSRLASYIYSCSLASNYTAYNWYGPSTTRNNIYEAASGANHPFSIAFYIGHGRNRTQWIIETHYDIITNNGTWVADDWIYPHSACQNVRFVFLWSCKQGDTIGGTHFWTGPYGMPHA
jgi:hypothetical protein